MRNRDQKDILILSLIIVVIILFGILSYAFLVRPALNGLVVKGQTEGIQYAVFAIMQQAATCKQVPLTYENQTINIIAVECLK